LRVARNVGVRLDPTEDVDHRGDAAVDGFEVLQIGHCAGRVHALEERRQQVADAGRHAVDGGLNCADSGSCVCLRCGIGDVLKQRLQYVANLRRQIVNDVHQRLIDRAVYVRDLAQLDAERFAKLPQIDAKVLRQVKQPGTGRVDDLIDVVTHLVGKLPDAGSQFRHGQAKALDKVAERD